jgi:transposase InsO family protein
MDACTFAWNWHNQTPSLVCRRRVPLRPSRGRPRTPGLDFIAQRVHEFREARGIRCGYRHTAESIALPGEAPRYEAVYRLLHPLDARPARLPRVHTRRFVARYVDYLWHTDLHEIQVTDELATGIYTLCLIAFIDDASRFIIQHRLLSDKKSATCARVLAEAFQSAASPCVLGSDNRGDLIGDAFSSVLDEFGIFHWRTQRHTPEQNRKMERFWPALENARNGRFSEQLIGDIVREYNNRWKHRSLRRTPAAARYFGINWQDPNAVIDATMEGNLDWTASINFNHLSFQLWT